MTLPTLRGPMTEKRRQHIFSENCTGHNTALCCNCGRPIHRHDDDWMIEHKRALGLLGPDTNPNCGPSHVDCGNEKTAKRDIPAIAKAKRMAKAGAKKKPARAFQVPAGITYDWRQRRYVQKCTASEAMLST